MRKELFGRIATISGMASAVVAGSAETDAGVVSWTVNQVITPGPFTVMLTAPIDGNFRINFGSAGNGTTLGDRYIWGPNNNLSFVYQYNGPNDPVRLGGGTAIDNNRSWFHATSFSNTDHDIQRYWSPGDTGYAGIRFEAGPSAYHYGWVEMTMLSDGRVRIDSWALEEQQNVFVTTPSGAPSGAVPEPTSAGIFALAAGAAGLRALRRKNRTAAQSEA